MLHVSCHSFDSSRGCHRGRTTGLQELPTNWQMLTTMVRLIHRPFPEHQISANHYHWGPETTKIFLTYNTFAKIINYEHPKN